MSSQKSKPALIKQTSGPSRPFKTREKKGGWGDILPYEHGISYRKKNKKTIIGSSHMSADTKIGKIGISYERCFYDLATKVEVHRKKILR